MDFKSFYQCFGGNSKHPLRYVPEPGAVGRDLMVDVHQVRRQLPAPCLPLTPAQRAQEVATTPTSCKQSGLLWLVVPYCIHIVLSLIPPNLHLHILLIICMVSISWADQTVVRTHCLAAVGFAAPMLTPGKLEGTWEAFRNAHMAVVPLW